MNNDRRNTTGPQHKGYFYPVHNRMCIYISDFIKNIKREVYNSFFVSLDNEKERKAPAQAKFKMEEPVFAKQFNLRQSIKYGAIVYIIAAMLAMPVGICSTQHTTAHLYPINPVKSKPIELPTFMTLLDQHAAVQAAKDHTAAQPFFHNHVLKASKAYGVDAALIRAIILAESSNNPKAVSHRGAQGLMQLMPRTARWLGVKDSFNPAHNIDGGVRYVRRLLDLYNGDVKLALAAYNAGRGHVRNYGGVPPFKATKTYIKKVLEYRQHFERALAACQLDAIIS